MGRPTKKKFKNFVNKKDFAKKYNVNFSHMDKPSSNDESKNKSQMKNTLESVLSLYNEVQV